MNVIDPCNREFRHLGQWGNDVPAPWTITDGRTISLNPLSIGSFTKIVVTLDNVTCGDPSNPIPFEAYNIAPILFTLIHPSGRTILIGFPHAGDVGYQFKPDNPTCFCDQGPLGYTNNEAECDAWTIERCKGGKSAIWTFTYEVLTASTRRYTISTPGVPDLSETQDCCDDPTDFFSVPVDVRAGDVPREFQRRMLLDHNDRTPRGMVGARILTLEVT